MAVEYQLQTITNELQRIVVDGGNELLQLLRNFKSGMHTKDSPALPTPVVEKGILYGLAAKWYDDKGDIFIDPFGDWVMPGSWKNGIQLAEAKRKSTNNPYLMPHLWQHSKNDIIGGVL